MVKHDGHRKRIKDRFLSSNTESFASHELLEMVLFYALPRENTNLIAHELMQRFGSVKNIGLADIKELTEIKGISENGAVLLKLIVAIAERCAIEDLPKNLIIKSESDLIDYAKRLYVGANQEIVYLLMFNLNMMLIDTLPICFGTINESKPIMRSIVEKCISNKVSNVIILHNHVSDDANPSNEDVEFTVEANKVLNLLGINLIDHFIIANNSHVAILHLVEGKMKELDGEKIKFNK